MGEEGSNTITLNIMGSTKCVEVDLNKLRESMKIIDKHVDEKPAVAEQQKDDMLDIDLDTISEEEFLVKAIQKIGPIQKNPATKTLTKDSFIKIFKFTGYFAKIKSKDLKKVA